MNKYSDPQAAFLRPRPVRLRERPLPGDKTARRLHLAPNGIIITLLSFSPGGLQAASYPTGQFTGWTRSCAVLGMVRPVTTCRWIKNSFEILKMLIKAEHEAPVHTMLPHTPFHKRTTLLKLATRVPINSCRRWFLIPNIKTLWLKWQCKWNIMSYNGSRVRTSVNNSLFMLHLFLLIQLN